MSYQQLGQPDRAQDCYERAKHSWEAQTQLSANDIEELAVFLTEADAILHAEPRE